MKACTPLKSGADVMCAKRLLPAQIGIMRSNWQEIYRVNPIVAKMPILSTIMLEEIKSDARSAKRTLGKALLSLMSQENAGYSSRII